MLPFKTAILEYASKHVGEDLTVENIMEGMKDTPYAKEAQFLAKRVDEYCIAFNSCGYFENVDSKLLDTGDISLTYRISEAGLARVAKSIK